MFDWLAWNARFLACLMFMKHEYGPWKCVDIETGRSFRECIHCGHITEEYLTP